MKPAQSHPMSKGRREFTMTPFEDEPGDDDDPPDDAGSESGGENEDCNVEKKDRNEQEDEEEEDSEQWETPAKRRSAPVKRIWELEHHTTTKKSKGRPLQSSFVKNSPRSIATLVFILFIPNTKTDSSCMGFGHCSASG
jgi:hypothetical protein